MKGSYIREGAQNKNLLIQYDEMGKQICEEIQKKEENLKAFEELQERENVMIKSEL